MPNGWYHGVSSWAQTPDGPSGIREPLYQRNATLCGRHNPVSGHLYHPNLPGPGGDVCGFIWAAEELTDTCFILHIDNTAVYSSLQSGTGRTFRHPDLRRLDLSMLHKLRGNTFRVEPVAGSGHNPADLPSRQVFGHTAAAATTTRSSSHRRRPVSYEH